ncbi:hypothetical protein PG994_005605 [Apiospora phragmitis]|uniref:Rhodopsin domain-containing protein n=1 Tax=Apiospora phragmitis TaxID=2905665 RepID=A0ABR1VG69_9PEZI
MDPFTTEAFTLLGIGLMVIAVRTYIRVHAIGLKGLQSDDYLMWVVAFAFSMETMIAYMVSHFWQGLANSSMTDEYRKTMSPSDPEYRLRLTPVNSVNGSKTHIVGWCSYTLVLWATKGSMCAFYLRLTEGLEPLAGRVRVGFYLLAATYVAVTSTILFACGLPFEKNWQIYPDPGNSCQTTVSIVNYIVTVTLNILTDTYLMAIPVPMLLNARLRTAKKLGLCLLFSGGIFVAIAAILRCVLALKASPPPLPVLPTFQDAKDNADTSASWAVRESFVAILVTNMPVLWPSVLRATQVVRSTLLLGYSSRTEGGSSQRPVYELRTTEKGRRVRKSMYHVTTSGFSEFTDTTGTTTTTSPGSKDMSIGAEESFRGRSVKGKSVFTSPSASG